MEELQIVNLENTDIAHWDMAMLEAQLEQRLAYYKGMVYTDDSIKSAKDDRTTLNKAKKVIEDATKAYKESILGIDRNETKEPPKDTAPKLDEDGLPDPCGSGFSGQPP